MGMADEARDRGEAEEDMRLRARAAALRVQRHQAWQALMYELAREFAEAARTEGLPFHSHGPDGRKPVRDFWVVQVPYSFTVTDGERRADTASLAIGPYGEVGRYVKSVGPRGGGDWRSYDATAGPTHVSDVSPEVMRAWFVNQLGQLMKQAGRA